MKLLWLLAGCHRPTGKHTYMAASNLMSLHLRSQQGKGMPALLIPLYWPYISAGCQCRGLHPERLEKAETTRWEDRQKGMHLFKTVQYRIYLKNASCRLIAQLIKAAFPSYPQKITKIMLNWVSLGFRLLVEQKWYQEVNLGSGKKWKAYSCSFIPDKINKGISSAL